MSTIEAGLHFAVTRFGVMMSAKAGEPHEAWGCTSFRDSSRKATTRESVTGACVSTDRIRSAWSGLASGGGGVEDPRVVYVAPLKRYVMTYTAFVPYEPRVAVAVSEDLVTWQRLGVLEFEVMPDHRDLNKVRK